MAEEKENSKKSKVDMAMSALNTKDITNVFKFSVGIATSKPRLSTGSYKVNKALGGGFTVGGVHEIYGPASSGKTTLALQTMAEAQKHGKILFVDLEYSFSPTYAQALGVNLDELYISQPECAEVAFDVIETMVATGAFSLIVVDSVAGLVPRAELEGDSGDSHMGKVAKLFRQHLRKMIKMCSVTDAVALYINQITYKLGVTFGNPETTTGGTALSYFALTRTDLRKISKMSDAVKQDGVKIRARIVKNKTFSPFQEGVFLIDFGKGVNLTSEIIDFAVEQNIVDKSGSWFSYGETSIGQGRTNAVQFLEDNLEILKEIKSKIKI